jgi:hypothetical protein
MHTYIAQSMECVVSTRRKSTSKDHNTFENTVLHKPHRVNCLCNFAIQNFYLIYRIDLKACISCIIKTPRLPNSMFHLENNLDYYIITQRTKRRNQWQLLNSCSRIPLLHLMHCLKSVGRNFSCFVSP